MSRTIKVILVLIVIKSKISADFYKGVSLFQPPCYGNDYINTNYTLSRIFGSFFIDIKRRMNVDTEIRIRFSEEATIAVIQPKGYLTKLSDNEYKIILLERTKDFRVFVTGKVGDEIIFVTISSLKIDGREHCKIPTCGLYDWAFKKHPEQKTCGRRKINHNQLIVLGSSTKPGDWPWHVALNRIYRSIFRYICGGTLISNSFVITAAHCVTKNGVAVLPESLGVSLGKYNLIGGDKDPQEREVFKIIVHEGFDHKNLDDDIALLKLSTAAVFNDYIQPACLSYDIDVDKIPSGEIIGAVAGWGFDQSHSLSTELRYTKMPLVQDIVCIRRKPIFYAPFMNGKRFCAGILNNTSACNGDSGGGFVVFVPDTPKTESNSDPDGVWFIRGIVSMAYSRQDDNTICDPNEYVLFTDIDQYKDWISDNMK